MPYNPQADFNVGPALSATVQGLGSLGEGVADMQKKKQIAEAQAAGAQFGFETLKKAGLVSMEEEERFLKGNANQKNAIVMGATPRLVQQHQKMQEAAVQKRHMDQMVQQGANRANQLKIAGMRDVTAKPYGLPDLNKDIFAMTNANVGTWMNSNPKLSEDGKWMEGQKDIPNPAYDERYPGEQPRIIKKRFRMPKAAYDKFISQYNALTGNEPEPAPTPPPAAAAPSPTPAPSTAPTPAPTASPQTTPKPAPSPRTTDGVGSDARPAWVESPEHAQGLPPGAVYQYYDPKKKKYIKARR